MEDYTDIPQNTMTNIFSIEEYLKDEKTKYENRMNEFKQKLLEGLKNDDSCVSIELDKIYRNSKENNELKIEELNYYYTNMPKLNTVIRYQIISILNMKQYYYLINFKSDKCKNEKIYEEIKIYLS